VNFEYRPWPPYGAPSLTFPIAQTALILLGAAAMWWNNRRAAVSVRWLPVLGLLVTLLCGAGFILLGLEDWSSKPFALSSNAYSSIYFVMTGVHLIHTAIGALMALAVMVWSTMGYFGPVRHVPITVTAIYWYFLAATWAALFFVLYITPYLGSG
jgi:cytochrome c oxidase subunit III